MFEAILVAKELDEEDSLCISLVQQLMQRGRRSGSQMAGGRDGLLAASAQLAISRLMPLLCSFSLRSDAASDPNSVHDHCFWYWHDSGLWLLLRCSGCCSGLLFLLLLLFILSSLLAVIPQWSNATIRGAMGLQHTLSSKAYWVQCFLLSVMCWFRAAISLK
ncbi:hypothetical protein O6H91_15G077200 [Diphasiastrum complanatum]|uniref:Uncharacterized protein n=1 Tax=Diphasiastrum complanatum TaxID=34168 RepID=A0ACC2BJW8_DIPCM|nr:hypothetical protein O6H91_15G077200 [Diphasiastrum complanatum]